MPFRPNLFVCLALALAASAANLACGGSTDPGVKGEEKTALNRPGAPAVGVSIASASLGNGSANVQLAFVAFDARSSATVSVESVVLVDAKSGTVVDTLEASSPSVWNGQTYEPWNEKVTPGGDLRASYTLSGPDWGSLGAGEGDRSSMSTPYRLRITLRIDGAETTVESGDLQREPEMVT